MNEQEYLKAAIDARKESEPELRLTENQLFIMALFHDRIKSKPLDEFTAKLMIRYCPNFVSRLTTLRIQYFMSFVNKDRENIAEHVGRFLYASVPSVPKKRTKWTDDKIADIIMWRKRYLKLGRKKGVLDYVHARFVNKYPDHQATKKQIRDISCQIKKKGLGNESI